MNDSRVATKRRTHADALTWCREGTALLIEAVDDWGEPEYQGATRLAGWTRKHLVAHLAANADALGNLVHWARTGERRPMYTSGDQRNADIAAGALRTSSELGDWLRESSVRLDDAMRVLDDRAWAATVVTAQGRSVSAEEVPWMRAREVMVHAVDLLAGVTFADLPAGFLVALADDAAAKRSTQPGPAVVVRTPDGDEWNLADPEAALTEPALVTGALPDATAYLVGRLHLVLADDGRVLPELPPWL